MLSRPVALWGFTSFSSFCMPCKSTLVGGALWMLLGPTGKSVVFSC